MEIESKREREKERYIWREGEEREGHGKENNRGMILSMNNTKDM